MPRDRAAGFVPIAEYPFLTPGELASYVGPHPRDGWDVAAQWREDSSPDDYAAAGATWLVRSTWPADEGWLAELQQLAGAPPG